ncbi:MAG: tetratricopeptide repeat protein [bacterium]
MAFEKGKVLKAAEKFLSQGKINAAIKEYRQIVDNDPDDFTALNMLGDLLTRAGEKEEASSCFSRIAEHYRDQEFRLKAIAMYKKIEKLNPGDPATAKTLAELYAAQGLVVDARRHYLIVADAYSRAGDSKSTLKVLHKIADLDPNNTSIRLKLAEGYLKENMQAEAAKAFGQAANRLLENGAFEESLAAYSKALEMRPNDRELLRGVASAHAALGTSEDAAELLEVVVAASPDDPELISMLAEAYIQAEDAAGAERAISLLISQDASNYRRYVEVARVYLKAGNENESARILGTILEPMLAGREENDLLELVDELLARNPEHVASLRLLARIHWWQRDMEKLRSVLERLAESAQAEGLADEERYALTQLVRLAPEEQAYMDRLNTLGGFLEEVSEGTSMVGDPSLAGVPSFESFAIVDDSMNIVSEPEAVESGASDEFEWNSVADEAVTDASSSFADLNETNERVQVDSDLDVPSQPAPAEPSSQDFEFNTSAVEQTPATQSDTQPAPSAEGMQAMMKQELESVDFYITQGYSDIAIDTLELLERQFGSHPEIDARREKLQPGMPDTGAAVSQPDIRTTSGTEVAFESPQPPVVTADNASPLSKGSGIDSGLAEIFEEFRAEAEGDHASSNEDFETHYNTATAYKEMGLLDEAIREFQTATGLTVPADGTPRYFQCCNMLGHCFVQKGMPGAAVLWFKKGLDAPERTADEYKALQYELGSAYEEMGDLKRALAVFTEVYGVDVGYRDIADKLSELQVQIDQKKEEKRKVDDE